MVFSEKDLDDLWDEYQEIFAKHHKLSKAYAFRTYNNERAREFALHGVSRRLNTLVRCKVDALRRGEQVVGEDMTLDLLSHVRIRYGVSLLAAVRKWVEFTDTQAAIVVARDGFALWGRGKHSRLRGRASTAAYKVGVFIRPGRPIQSR